MKHLIPLVIKEMKQIRRDVSAIILAFVLPILMIILFGYCINLDSSVTTLALVTEDEAPVAHSLIEDVTGSNNFKVFRVSDRTTGLGMLHKGEVDGMLILPSDFSKACTMRGEVKLLLATDGTVPNTAQFTSLYVQSIVQSWLALQHHQASKITVTPLYLYNQAAISRYYILPGAIAVVLSFVGTLLTTMVVAREWERGTIEGILSSSIGRFEFILSKLIPYFILGMGAMTVCSVTAIFLFHVPMRASIFLVIGISSIFLLSVLSIGLLISTLVRAQYTASLIAMNVSILPTIMLSGFIYEISSMPSWVQCISLFIPARYFSNSLSSLFLAGNSGSLLVLNTVFLVISAIFWLGLVYILTPKRLDE
jgi:ABC-2 type transport system permease protein